METLSFIMQYMIKPRTVGAILPSSQRLAERMVEDIDFNNAGCIVEYGPGTGVFTEKLLNNRKAHTQVLVIEHNYDFYSILKSKYENEQNFHIVNDSAENVDRYLRNYNISSVDYVVSGLPFASLPQDVSAAILGNTKQILKEDGKFITFQYTLFKKEFIKGYFNSIKIKREFRNIPPAYVFSCTNQK